MAKEPFLLRRGNDGSTVIWNQRAAVLANGDDVFIQRLTPDGTLEPGWEQSGRTVISGVGDQYVNFAFAGLDDTTYIDYSSYDPTFDGEFLSRVLPDGSVDPTWGGGALLWATVPAEPYNGETIRADDGGFYVVWSDTRTGSGLPFPNIEDYLDIYLQRVTPDGAIAPGWPAAGMLVCSAPGRQWFPRLVTDGADGAYIAWGPSGSLGNGIHVCHVRPNGEMASGWSQAGVLAFGSQGYQDYPEILADGEGGVYVAASVFGEAGSVNGNSHVLVQHIAASGAFDAPWDSLGHRVNLLDTSQSSPWWIYEGPGRAILTWYDVTATTSLPMAQLVQFDGVVSTAATLISQSFDSRQLSMVWDVSSLRASEFDVEKRTLPDLTWTTVARVARDGQGHISFTDSDVQQTSTYSYRLTWSSGGQEQHSEEAIIQIPEALKFSLAGARPNPAPRSALRIDFTTPRACQSSFELFDVTGRRVLQHDLGLVGPGLHSAALPEARSLPAGLYWVRLKAGTDQGTARLALVSQ